MAARYEPVYTLDLLPHEILEHVLTFPDVGIKDLCNASKTCTKLRDVVRSNALWRKKFAQRWPKLFHECNNAGTRWQEDCAERLACGWKLRRCISTMSERFYAHDELSHADFSDILQLSRHPQALLFYIDELDAILNDGEPHKYLTLKYYARRVQGFVCQEHLKSLWEDYLGFPDDRLSAPLLEDGALLLAQWCQPFKRIDFGTIKQTFDSLAENVLLLLAARHPNHPLLKASPESRILSGATLESLWTPSDCRPILLCLNQVLFQMYGLRGELQEYYSRENSFVDKVLEKKTGIPITLCVIYEAVARRLGVRLFGVSLPEHFLLRWLEHPQLSKEQRYTYVDAYNGGRFLTQLECPQVCPDVQIDGDIAYENVKPVQVIARMCWNLVEVDRQQEGSVGMQSLQRVLELLELLERLGHNPGAGQIEHRLLLARVYLHLGINYQDVLSLLQDIEAANPASSGIVAYMYRTAQSQMEAQRLRKETRHQRQLRKLRSTAKSKVAFTVGLIMQHKKYNYRCVIYGWDGVCAANRDWIYQMGVHNLSQRDRQPFYNVLVEDGSNRYAAQENLSVCTEPCPISHPEVGKYFERFCGTHYLPNAEKEAEYPEDAAERKELLHRAYGNLPT